MPHRIPNNQTSQRRSRMVRALASLTVFLMVGCAPLTPRQQEELAFRQADFELRFVAARDRCYEAGGRMIIDALGAVDPGDIPRRGARYFCAR